MRRGVGGAARAMCTARRTCTGHDVNDKRRGGALATGGVAGGWGGAPDDTGADAPAAPAPAAPAAPPTGGDWWSARLSAYVGALALLATFVRDNWTGPPLSPAVVSDVRLAAAADAVLVAAVGGGAPAPAAAPGAGSPPTLPSRAPWLDLAADGEEVVRGVVRPAALSALLGAGAVLRPGRSGLLADAGAGGVYGDPPSSSPPAPPSAEAVGDDASLLPDVAFSDSDGSDGGDGDGDGDGVGGPATAASTVDWLAAAAPDVLALVWVEAAHTQRQLYDGEGAAGSGTAAADVLGVRVRLSGALGVRTKYQQRPLAQLTAVVLRRAAPGGGGGEGDASAGATGGGKAPNGGTAAAAATVADAAAAAADAAAASAVTAGDAGASEGGTASAAAPDGDWPLPSDVPLDDADLLGFARLGGAAAGGDAAAADGAAAADAQAVVLGAGIAAGAGTVGSDALAVGERAAYAARVAAAAAGTDEVSSMVLAHALLLRCDGEASRGRFQERVLAQTAAVVDFVADAMVGAPASTRAAAAAERLRLAWASGVPAAWAVRLAHAQVLGRLGLVRSAMEVLAALDFVDELIDCHTLLGNAGTAEALVRRRLATADGGDPRAVAARPRLLCVLGDVTRSRSFYELAWWESRRRCARAQRSLAAAAMTDRRWADAVGHWEAALTVNALQADAWFALGVAHLSGGGGALPAARAFTRVVQQQPDNGQAWNNLGRALAECGDADGGGGGGGGGGGSGGSAGGGPRDAAALAAMREAAKHLRDAPEVWDNVITLAVRVGSTDALISALDALMRVAGADGVRGPALRAAADQVVAAAAAAAADARATAAPDGRTDASAAAARLCGRLLTTLRTATGLVSSQAGVWDAYATLHEGTPGGSAAAAVECRRKALVAALATGERWRVEAPAFRRAAAYALRWGAAAVVAGGTPPLVAAAGQLSSMLAQTAERWGGGGGRGGGGGGGGGDDATARPAWADLADVRALVVAALPAEEQGRFRDGGGGDATAAEQTASGGG
ncbi:hypothetical protein BU14_0126s0034 [Porphyra umbilicalis]|uniref:Uncharacterized protein n=1 Tax=Porphyra umbilicalis TaxID=2786 RepID=A0A1X6PB76_PORUM|nr:hypothetical protein BU14_0126s0034 [Porphyra umbilicalis]|eukprot:OSX77995.1 hypothetical protein BU14_0126s0034 [Porphyra umbilicalis]